MSLEPQQFLSRYFLAKTSKKLHLAVDETRVILTRAMEMAKLWKSSEWRSWRKLEGEAD